MYMLSVDTVCATRSSNAPFPGHILLPSFDAHPKRFKGFNCAQKTGDLVIGYALPILDVQRMPNKTRIPSPTNMTIQPQTPDRSVELLILRSPKRRCPTFHEEANPNPKQTEKEER